MYVRAYVCMYCICIYTIHSDIVSGIYADILCDILSCISIQIFRHFFWHSIWYIFGDSLWLKSGEEHSDPEMGWRPSGEHSDPQLALEILRRTAIERLQLRSGGGGGGG